MAMQVNAELDRPVYVHSDSLAWSRSPSRSVLRKRFFLRGPVEAGQVTSLVKYLPGAEFAAHGHPQGEEILVLDGVFRDESGDWPAGSWLLNPEGYSHAPCSPAGCLLFVKLRQYTGTEHKAIGLGSLAWRHMGAEQLLDQRDGARTRIVALEPGESLALPNGLGIEGFVVDGRLRVHGQAMDRHDWFRAPPGAGVTIESGGCALYLDEDSVTRLVGSEEMPG